MRIAFLSRYQNTIERGAENFVMELTSRLAKNYSVDVLAGSDADSLLKILKGKYDVVVPINGRLQSLKVSLGRVVGNHKLLITGQSGIGRDDIWNIVVVKPDVFVALTNYQASWAKKWAWGSRVMKIPNGIDLEKFKPEGGKIALGLPGPVILSVGALAWYKYHDRAIEAVARLGKGSLLVVGKGPDESKLEKLGRERLGPRFKLMAVNYKDLPEVYRSADLFTLPSWSREAFGIVYLEAMASGLPVVAPDDPQRREIIGEAGILVDCANLEKYAQALKQALDIKWGDRPRKQAEKFNWDKIAKEYEKTFMELVGRA